MIDKSKLYDTEGEKMKNKGLDILKFEEKLKKISMILFWILIVVMPLHTMLIDHVIGEMFPYGNLINLWRDVIILFFLICAVILRWRETLLSKLGLLIIGSLATMGLFWIFSDVPFMLKTNILRIYASPMLMVLVMQSFSVDEKLYDRILRVLFLQGAVITLFGLVQVFIMSEEFLISIGYGTPQGLHHSFYIGGFKGSQRMVSTFASPNNCGLYLTQLFTICWVNKDRLLRYWKWAGIGFLLMLIGIVATFSRSAWVSLFVILVLHFIIHEPNNKRLLNWQNAVVGIGVVAILWLVDRQLLNSRMTNMIFSSIKGVVTLSDPSFRKHLEDFISPIRTIIQHPLGVGFGVAGPIALDALGAGTLLVESSIWLVGYDMGFPGLIMYYLPYIVAILGIASRNNLCKRTSAYLALSTVIIFSILPLHQNVESTFLVFMFLGLANNPRLSARLNGEHPAEEK